MNDLATPDPAMKIPSAAVALQPNVVAKIFERYGELQLLVACRFREAPEIREMTELGSFTERNRAIALNRLDRIPSLPELRRDAENLHTATFGRAPEPEARLIVAMMLEAIPSAGAQASPGYIDAIIHEIEHHDDAQDNPAQFIGFSCVVLASAARRIWAKHRFAPSIAELLPVLRQTRSEYLCALGQTRRLIELRQDADEWIEIMDAEPVEIDPDEIPF